MFTSLLRLLLLLACAGVPLPGRAADDAPPAEITNVLTGTTLGTNASEFAAPTIPTEIGRTVIRGGGKPQPLVSLWKPLHLATNHSAREIVVVQADAQVEGRVRRDAVVVMGNATINGTIEGNLVVVMGNVRLGSNAQVRRDLILVAGALEMAPGAFVGGEINHLDTESIPFLADAVDWVRHGLLWGRPLPPGLSWIWKWVGGILVVYLLVLLLFPRPVQGCMNSLEERPLLSLFAGLLTLILIGPAIVLLAFTVVGIVLLPFLLCALLLALVLGKVALYRFIGLRLARELHLSFLEGALPSFLLGAAVVIGLGMIPILGLITWSLMTLFAVGIAVLGAFTRLKRESGRTPAPTPVFLMPPGSSPSIPATLPVAPFDNMAPPFIARPFAAEPAGFWLRFAATLLDFAIFLMVVLVLHLRPQVAFPFWLVYHIGMWTWKGATLGGLALRLKIVRTDGQPIDFGLALVRSLSALLSAAILFLGFFWAGWSVRKRSWHDLIAGTVIVRLPHFLPEPPLPPLAEKT